MNYKHLYSLLFLSIFVLPICAQKRNINLTIHVNTNTGEGLNKQPVSLMQSDFSLSYGNIQLNTSGTASVKVYPGNHHLSIIRKGFDEFETETIYSDEEQYGYDIAAWIEGDSMEPVYKSGEVALIRSNGFDYDGAVYALSWNDSVYIKKLYRDEDGFRMVSLNKDYPEKFIPYEDEPRIVGLVVGHFMPVEGV